MNTEKFKSPCCDCVNRNKDKNECLHTCEKIQLYQEAICKAGVYATITQ